MAQVGILWWIVLFSTRDVMLLLERFHVHEYRVLNNSNYLEIQIKKILFKRFMVWIRTVFNWNVCDCLNNWNIITLTTTSRNNIEKDDKVFLNYFKGSWDYNEWEDVKYYIQCFDKNDEITGGYELCKVIYTLLIITYTGDIIYDAVILNPVFNVKDSFTSTKKWDGDIVLGFKSILLPNIDMMELDSNNKLQKRYNKKQAERLGVLGIRNEGINNLLEEIHKINKFDT